MTRIAALIAAETVSGPGRQLAALAAPLRQGGWDLHVMVLVRNSGVQPAYVRHLEELGVDHSVVEDRGPVDPAIPAEVHARMRRIGARVIQTHGYKATAAGWLLRRTRRVDAWIGFFHGSTDKGVRDRLYHAIERRMLRLADRIVVVAAAQRTRFGDAAIVIPNAVLAGGADGGSCVLPAAPVRPLLGVVGRLSREKGVDIFLRACAELRRRGEEFSAVVVGDGPERAALERLAGSLGLARRVTFMGHCTSPQALYADLDMVVIPSRSEGLPNVLLEALAADRVVVATAVGAVPEVLATPSSGMLVEAGDAVALADGIVRARAFDGDRAAADARAEVVRAYSLEERVRRHLELYRGLFPRKSALLSA